MCWYSVVFCLKRKGECERVVHSYITYACLVISITIISKNILLLLKNNAIRYKILCSAGLPFHTMPCRVSN